MVELKKQNISKIKCRIPNSPGAPLFRFSSINNGHVTRPANVSSLTFSRNIKHRSEKLLKILLKKRSPFLLNTFLAYGTTFRTIEDNSAAVYEKEQYYTALVKSPEFRKYFFRRHLDFKLIQFSQ